MRVRVFETDDANSEPLASLGHVVEVDLGEQESSPEHILRLLSTQFPRLRLFAFNSQDQELPGWEEVTVANAAKLSVFLANRKQLKAVRGTSSFSDEQRIKRQIEEEFVRRNYKRQIEEEFVRRNYLRACSGFTISLPVEDVEEEKLWQHIVVAAGVPCAIAPASELLIPGRSILPQLRYLRFLLGEAQTLSLSSVVKMRAQRQQQQRDNDLELPYHPIIVATAQAAAAGQPDISFMKEDHRGSARPDLSSCVRGQPKYPAECKAKFGCAHQGSANGIASNRAALSKLLKVILSLHGDQASGKHLCLYFSRSEYVWVAQFLFATPGKLTSLQVSPAFPREPLQSPPLGHLMDLRQLDKLSSSPFLVDLLPPAMPQGFALLVQYADTLCELEGIEKVQLAASWMNNQPVDFTAARVIASSMKSLVVRLTPGSDAVVKISHQRLVAHERELHLTLDGRSSHLRSMTDSSQYAEVSSGVLPGLAMLELGGYGEPLQSHHMQPGSLGRGLVWDQASEGLSAMHAAGVLHRDPKPSNFLIINGAVQLNDFDISCRMDDQAARQNLAVGTPEFQSPKLAQLYKERDDWLALALALLKLEGIEIADKQAALKNACSAAWLPERMRSRIMQSLV